MPMKHSTWWDPNPRFRRDVETFDGLTLEEIEYLTTSWTGKVNAVKSLRARTGLTLPMAAGVVDAFINRHCKEQERGFGAPYVLTDEALEEITR